MYGRSGRLDITISSRQERSKRVLIGKLVYSDYGIFAQRCLVQEEESTVKALLHDSSLLALCLLWDA